MNENYEISSAFDIHEYKQIDQSIYKNNDQSDTMSISSQVRNNYQNLFNAFQSLMILLYLSTICVFSFMLYNDQELKQNIIKYLQSIQHNDFIHSLKISMVGTGLYILGFPFALCEMTLGLLISNFYQAFMISMIAKIIGGCFIFLTAQNVFRQILMAIFKKNIIFRTLRKSVQDKPIYMVALIKLMMIPSVFKQSTLGILDVPFKLFLITHIIVDSILATIFIYFGKQMHDLNDLFGITSTQFDLHTHHSNNNLNVFTRSFMLLSAIVLIYIIRLVRCEYEIVREQIKKEDFKQIEIYNHGTF